MESPQQQGPAGLNTRAVVIAVVLFVLIVVGMFGYAYLRNTEQPAVEPQVQEDEQNDEDRYSNIERIEGTHFYIDGVHTVVGEMPMPTPCDLLNVDATVAESFPEQVTLDFEVINNAEFCAEVITPARFKVSATASEDATFSAQFNGRDVELNLTPAAPGETPEDFEVFTKG